MRLVAPAFTTLVIEAQACRRCPTMDGRRRVLSDLNGRQDAPIMVIAEAPGRFGGEITSTPLVNDASGRHFTALLSEAGIDRSDLFITNAVLCNPQDSNGRNRKPSRLELQRCKSWLELQIKAVDPSVVIALGGVALAALGAIAEHDYRLQTHVCRALPWSGRTLIPLYHPSPLTRAWRSDANQAADFRWLGDYLRRRGLVAGVASSPNARHPTPDTRTERP